MNARVQFIRYLTTALLLSLLLSACSPALFKEPGSGQLEKPKSSEETLPWSLPPDSGGQVEEEVA